MNKSLCTSISIMVALISLAFTSCQQEASTPDSQTPITPIATLISPVNGATEVSPSISELVITFNVDMKTSYALGGNIWGSSPVYTWSDTRTLHISVPTLAETKDYNFTLNPSTVKIGFYSVDGIALPESTFSFTTATIALRLTFQTPVLAYEGSPLYNMEIVIVADGADESAPIYSRTFTLAELSEERVIFIDLPPALYDYRATCYFTLSDGIGNIQGNQRGGFRISNGLVPVSVYPGIMPPLVFE